MMSVTVQQACVFELQNPVDGTDLEWISARMRSDSVKNKSVYADQNHAPDLMDVRLEMKSV